MHTGEQTSSTGAHWKHSQIMSKPHSVILPARLSLPSARTDRASLSQKHSRVMLDQRVGSGGKWTGTGSQCWVTSDLRDHTPSAQCKAPAEHLSCRAQACLTADSWDAREKAQNSHEKSKISDSFLVFAGDEGGLCCPRTEEGDFFLSRVTSLSSITGTPVS